MYQAQNTVHSDQNHSNSPSEPADHGFGWYADAQRHVLEQERKARAGHQHPEQYIATKAEFRYYQALSWARDGMQQKFTKDEFACMVGIANTSEWEWFDGPCIGRVVGVLETGSADDRYLTPHQQKALARRLSELHLVEAAALIDICEVLSLQRDPDSFEDALIPLGFELKTND